MLPLILSVPSSLLWANKGPEEENDFRDDPTNHNAKLSLEPGLFFFFLIAKCCLLCELPPPLPPAMPAHLCAQEIETWSLLVPPEFLYVLSGDLPFMEGGDEIKMRHWQGKPIKAFFPTTLS